MEGLKGLSSLYSPQQMISSSLTKQLQELNLPENVVAKMLLLMDDAYDEGYGEGKDEGSHGYYLGQV